VTRFGLLSVGGCMAGRLAGAGLRVPWLGSVPVGWASLYRKTLDSLGLNRIHFSHG